MIEQSNSLPLNLNIWSMQGDRKIFDVGCACHLAHLCDGKGAKELSVNFKDFIIDIYYHFHRSAKWKKC